jgi:hypothetical protein
MNRVYKNRYEFEKKIGKGASGKIFLVIDKRDGLKLVFWQSKILEQNGDWSKIIFEHFFSLYVLKFQTKKVVCLKLNSAHTTLLFF